MEKKLAQRDLDQKTKDESLEKELHDKYQSEYLLVIEELRNKIKKEVNKKIIEATHHLPTKHKTVE